MKAAPALLSLLVLAWSAEVVADDQTLEKPNIVYVLADDLGYGDVQCFNTSRGKIKTPNIDRLASQGMKFTDAHSGSAVCSPTRYGLLTGRYAWRTRLQRGVLDGYVEPLISDDRLTVGKLLQRHGYHTAVMGKWHLGFTIEGAKKDDRKRAKAEGAELGAVTRDGPVTRGFHEFLGFHHSRIMRSVFENDRVTRLVEPIDVLPLLTERAVEYVSKRAATGEPFFLYLALNSPHTPIAPAVNWQQKSGLGEYGDFVMQTDAAVGKVLDAIERAGISEKTIVVFSSDNGCSPAAGTPKLESLGHFASERFRGYKSDIWEGGHRVPFVVRWPGHVKAQAESRQVICHTDFLATCAQILGVTLPADAGEDSVSILPALLSRDHGPLREAIVHHSIQGKFAIRKDDWKLVACTGSGGWSKGGGDEPIQLYDMSQDERETTNVAAEHPDLVKSLGQLLQDYVARGRSTPGAPQSNDVPVANDSWKTILPN